MITGSASFSSLFILGSKLPRMIPITRGTSAATRAIRGMSAIPAEPRAIMVKKGPSFRDTTAMAPWSASSPYILVSTVNIPPLELDIPEMMATADRPSRLSLKMWLAIRPTAILATSLASVTTAPTFNALPAPLMDRLAPTQTKNAPRNALVLVSTPVVAPPICRKSGKKLLSVQPTSSGISMMPPGILFMKLTIGTSDFFSGCIAI